MRYLTIDECARFGAPGSQNEVTPIVSGGSVLSVKVYTHHASGRREARQVNHGSATYGRLVERIAPQPTDWPAACAALAGLDGGEWDAESARLETLWKAKYVGAFVAEAVSRKWSRENAEAWAAQIANEALLIAFESEPAVVARGDVVECELEAASADPR